MKVEITLKGKVITAQWTNCDKIEKYRGVGLVYHCYETGISFSSKICPAFSGSDLNTIYLPGSEKRSDNKVIIYKSSNEDIAKLRYKRIKKAFDNFTEHLKTKKKGIKARPYFF